MLLNEETKNKIIEEYNEFKESMYAGKSLEERKELDQFFTPPEITIPMIEKFDCDSLAGLNILDPTSGSGNLLAAALIAGADADKIFGNDYDADMVKICRKRLALLAAQLGKTGFKDCQIHQGNAMHSFCVQYFDDDYDELYFDSAKDDPKARIRKMESKTNDAGARKRLKKANFDKWRDEIATDEELKKCNKNDNVDESNANTKPTSATASIENEKTQAAVETDLW